MTASQLAYFLLSNKVVSAEGGEDLITQIKEEALGNPAHFSVFQDFVYLSPWSSAEKVVIQYVFAVMGKVNSALQQMNLSQTLALSLLLFKRLSDIERGQQVTGPVLPEQFKFNSIVQDTTSEELPERVLEVMNYIEATGVHFAEVFSVAREELTTISDQGLARKFKETMLLLAGLKLDEEHVATPLFQAIFSRLLWINVKVAFKEAGGEGN
ncbi:hypothetical protein [Rufibacter tibetensis]|uniref:Uncharacterized protein n=1 Tax=Rufibacter tibetensis TaxID=512763 RepID=A0A0P0CUP3_9BACT|nr:hypothetical protein [Rufibacter tibetensis]ALI98091.1 hypothetical protein DC20_02745 [Rufibacter tibetensis]